MSVTVNIHHRVSAAVNITVSTLPYGKNVGRLVLGIIPIDIILNIPMGVFRQKPSQPRRVISRSQVIIPGFRFEVFAGVAEGVHVGRHGREFHAEGVVGVGLVISVRAGAVLVREPAEGVIRRRDRVAREARIAAAVPVRVIAVRLLLEVRRALRGGDPGDEVRRVVGVALLYAVAEGNLLL